MFGKVIDQSSRCFQVIYLYSVLDLIRFPDDAREQFSLGKLLCDVKFIYCYVPALSLIQKICFKIGAYQ